VSLRPTTEDKVSTNLDLLIEFLVVERRRKDRQLNYINSSHKLVVLLIFILICLVLAGFGCLGVFMLISN